MDLVLDVLVVKDNTAHIGFEATKAVSFLSTFVHHAKDSMFNLV